MFVPQNLKRTVTQKKRNTARGGSALFTFTGAASTTQHAIMSLSSGFLHPRCLESFYTHTRKLFNIPQKSTKFWLNLHACHLVTRKALNVRMGKGKGSKIGMNAVINAGTRLIGLNFGRLGL
jgi:ribosomal protein L16/L10AE